MNQQTISKNAIETKGLGKRYRSFWALKDCSINVPKAVSYTHLDVYKRQVLVGRNILRGKFLVDVERGHNELIVIEKHSEQATKDFVI